MNHGSPNFGYPTEFKEQVRSQTDLVALVGETVALTPKGANDFVGLCPFHDDHNPSFHVYPDRQSYRCWVCQEAGDCYSWVMHIDALPFRDALESLAERAHIDLPKNIRQQSPAQKDRKQFLHDLVQWAEELCHQFLLRNPTAQPAREYLANRKFTAETIEKFRIGFHPHDWNWLLEQGRLKRYTPQDLTEAGLAIARKNGNGFHDHQLFVGRIVFPIRDLRGKPVAFGGRILPNAAANSPNGNTDDGPKYINSSDNPLFAKSTVLYAFDQSRDEIRKTQTAIVMEGYTDCITAHQHGVHNVVASLGTALNENHVRNLKRFAHKVILMFDGDDAGQRSAQRAVGRFLAEAVDLRILSLPQGLDPADYLNEHGREAFEQLLDTAVEAWEFTLQRSVQQLGVESVDSRQRILQEMATLIASVPGLQGTSREAMIVSGVARRLLTDERVVQTELQQARGKNQQRTRLTNNKPAFNKNANPNHTPYSGSDIPPDFPGDDDAETQADDARQSSAGKYQSSTKDDVVEHELLEIVLAVPALVDRLQREIGADSLRNKNLRYLLQLCYDLAERGDDPSFDKLTAVLEDVELKRLLTRIDDDARRKKIDRLLQDDREFTTNDGTRTTYLEYVIGQVRLRCERVAQEPLKSQLAGLVPADQHAVVPATDPLKMLAQLQHYHARRANPNRQ